MIKHCYHFTSNVKASEGTTKENNSANEILDIRLLQDMESYATRGLLSFLTVTGFSRFP